MRVTKGELKRFAAEVRDMAHHAANVAPLHGKDPLPTILAINLDALVNQFWIEDEESEGVRLIEEERERQKVNHSLEHDDQWEVGEMAMVAACYAAPERIYTRADHAAGVSFQDPFPWEPYEDRRPHNGNVIKAPKRKEAFRLLVRAGALIAAEIDRLLRTKGGSKLKLPGPDEDEVSSSQV